MRERLENLLGPVARAIWILTFHAACGRILRREAQRLGYRSNFTIYDQADQVRLTKQVLEELEKDPKRFVPRGIHAQISAAKNQLVTPGRVRRARRVVLRPDRRRGVRPLPAAPVRLERGRLRRPADADRAGARALPGGARALAEGLPLRARGRVPGHEPRAVPAAAAAGREAPQRLRGRRPGPVDLRVPRRRHPQHPRVRARLRRDEDRRARAELPLDEHDPPGRERGDRAQPRAQAEEPLVGARRGRAGARARGRGRARRGALRRRRDRRARRGGLRRQRDRGLLPDERAVAGAGGRARPPGRRLPGDRRPALLRARRGEGRDRLPAGDRQPVRRRLAAADRQPAAARDRRRLARAAAGPRRRVRDLALGGARPGRGGGHRGRAAQGGAAVPRPAAVADGRRARHGRARGDRARARAQRLPRRAARRADDRGAGPDREPPGARRRRAGVPAHRATSRRSRASCRRSRSTPTRTRSAASRASSR